MTTPAENAVARLNLKFNCAQSVFSSFAARFGMDETTALKLASPFGGGVARRGEICGAVSGALMAIGLGHGASVPEDKERIYRLGQEFLQRFEAKHGSLLCRDLIECDLSTAEGWKEAQDRQVTARICTHLVADAAQIVTDIFQNIPETPHAPKD